MIVCLTKDYKHYEILYDSQEEAQAVVDYQEQLLVRGVVENPDIEKIAAAVHKSYCVQYEKKHGTAYWTNGDYNKLDEPTKEFDRVTVRTVLAVLQEKAYFQNEQETFVG